LEGVIRRIWNHKKSRTLETGVMLFLLVVGGMPQISQVLKFKREGERGRGE
jgi:hypothetical protein